MQLSLQRIVALPPKGTHDVKLPRTVIGVLVQMRARMSTAGLEDLAASIKEVGQHTPGLVVALSADEAKEYLASINGMWGTEYSLSEFESVFLTEMNCSYYLFLVAGHRRFRAVDLAGLPDFYARLHFETEFSDALLMQYHENIHEHVPPDNEARFVTLLWRKAKKENTKLTLGQFARSLGKKPETVRRSIRFTALPVKVQELVMPSEEFKKGIAFALLCELARLQEARIAAKKGYSDQELMQLAYVLVTQYKTAKSAAAWVSTQIRVLQGQSDMFNLSIVDALDGARKTVSTRLEGTVRAGHEHLRVVARLHKESQIPKVISRAAVSAVENTLRVAHDLAPQIVEGIRGGRGATSARATIKRVAKT